ncbi:MAG: Type I Iterative PKS [Vezdaea aestivalis]|nr:MAG: Type I Iterative PKS [Vezdaea aestivalis]
MASGILLDGGLSSNGIGSGSDTSSSDWQKVSPDVEPENTMQISDKLEPIAIIGMDLKFPQDAATQEGFWKMLLEGRSAYTEVPKDRYNVDAFYHPDGERQGAFNVKGGHFIEEDHSRFDAPFFSITPAEAACMDPQQRFLLEGVYKALENSGIPMSEAIGTKTAVYVGCFTRDFEQVVGRDSEVNFKYMATGTGTAMLSNRLSWFYNFTGPSISLDTACSSSLNAFHLACQSLRTGEVSMGICAGTNLFSTPQAVIPLTQLGFLSPDGRCFSFDHRANGYARGEGVGTLIVKRLSDALRDGDTIRAVVRATGSNQDGKSPGITQPLQKSQMTLIRETYAAGGLNLDDTRYFEAHGTGTQAGDPIEAAAISGVFNEHRSKEDPLYFGSVKSNIGHLEGAAGMAGLFKAILTLERGVILPNIGFEKINPRIPLAKWNMKIPLEPTPWPTSGLRRASINGFGYGGSNAHAVLDDAFNYLSIRGLEGRHRTAKLPPSLTGLNGGLLDPSKPTVAKKHALLMKANPKVFVWSASDEGGLARLASTYLEHFTKNAPNDEETYLNDLAYTLSAKRTSFAWKSSMVADSFDQLKDILRKGLSKPIRSKTNVNLGFIFTGQGAQWFGMGRELMGFPVYKNALLRAQSYLKSIGCKWFLIDELNKDAKTTRINSPAFSQPICCAVQIALVELLRSWEIYPSSVIGHSSGEIAAAYAVGGLSEESAWKVAYHRGALSAGLAMFSKIQGSMMAAGLSPEKADIYLEQPEVQAAEGEICVGCFNSPRNVTFTGSEPKIDALKKILDSEDIFARKLKVDNAYHSAYMNEIAFSYWKEIINISSGEAPAKFINPKFYSTVTGQKMAIDQLDQPEYWVKNMVSPVKFSAALACMCTPTGAKSKKLDGTQDTGSIDRLIEIGPHAALSGPSKEALAENPKTQSIGYESVLFRGVSALKTTLNVAGHLHCQGYAVDLIKLNHPGEKLSKLSLLVNLPPYAFNHSEQHWAESRLSREFRFREHARHELLGVRDPDWNPHEARWRHFIRVSENPWIRDHKITGSTLYPGAGALCMAIEASRQTADHTKEIASYVIKEVCFSKPLNVPLTAEGVETHVYLRNFRESSTASSSMWKDFRLYCFENDQWKETCRAIVGIEYVKPHTAVDGGREDQMELEMAQELYKQGEKNCKIKVDTKQLYELFDTAGFNFGPMFNCLEDLRYSDDEEAISTIKPRDVASKQPKGKMDEHVIHPTTLDAILQMIIPTLTQGGRDLTRVMIPSFIGELRISHRMMQHPEQFKLHCKAENQGFREARATMYGLSDDMNALLAILKDFRTVAITGRIEKESVRRLCYNIDWKPDGELIDHVQANKLFQAPKSTPREAPDQKIADLELMSYFFISDCIQNLTDDIATKILPEQQRYVEWMKLQVKKYSSGLLPHGHPDWEHLLKDKQYMACLVERVETSTVDGTLGATVGKNLLQILTGDIDAKEVMFADEKVQKVHREGLGAQIASEKMTSYIDALVHKKSDMKILEIGAGNGGTTLPIITTLTHHGENEAGSARFSHYDYTDITSAPFEKAHEKFQHVADRMSFRVLDISKNPIQQGFEANYDLIIAGSVFHAVANMETSLANARLLLKPGGKLILLELTNPSVLRAGFIFGVLPGWWLGEDEKRKWGPTLTTKDWDALLSRAKFSGVDIALHDFEGNQNQLFSVLISTAAAEEPEPEILTPEITIIAADHSELQQKIAQQLKFRFEMMNAPTCEIISLRGITSTTFKHKFCVFLPELEESILSDIDAEEYTSLQKIIASADGILWLTQGGGVSNTNPDAELVTGLARCIRSEMEGFAFLTLSVEKAEDPVKMVDIMIKVFKEYARKGSAAERVYAERDGVFWVQRVIEAHYLNHDIAKNTSAGRSELRKFGENPDRPLALTIGTPGLLNTLEFEDDPVTKLPLGPGEIEIEIKATGLNFLDLMISLGNVSDSFLGGEVSGVISRAAPDATFKPGDRVCACVKGGYQTFARVHSLVTQKIPDNMDFAAAAAIPVVFCTAYYALYDIARMTKDESVLIHWAAGGVGQAAVQLAKLIGAEIFVTIGSEVKKQFIIENFQIPEDHIFSSRDLTFVRGVKRMTKGRGVDVILNSLSGDSLKQSWECIAPFGRFLEIGKYDIQSSGRLPMKPFAPNCMFMAIDLSFMNVEGGHILSRLMKEVMNLAHHNKIVSPQPIHTYPYSKLEEAFRFMQGGTHMGKIVLEADRDDLVKVLPDMKPTYGFDPSASYLIAGGLGGLGRSMARWFARRGARNLILLSRSGATSDAAKELVSELEAGNVRVATPTCDITKEESLAMTLEECAHTMPPVKGCIQASMVLRDSIFENMSLADFKTGIKPKVQGTWALHKQLPSDLDFFVILSSASGISGNRGQANYSAGNTFEDAFARYRSTLGLKCSVSLDLGMMLSVGFVAENQEVVANLKRNGFIEVREEEFIAMLEYHCNPALGTLPALKSQVITGMETPAQMRARGLDDPVWLADPLFRQTFQMSSPENEAADENGVIVNYEALLRATTSVEEASAVVTEALVRKLSKALSTPESDIDSSKPMHSYGVDSLVAVEIRNWFSKAMGADVAVFDIMGSGSIASLGGVAATRSRHINNEC